MSAIGATLHWTGDRWREFRRLVDPATVRSSIDPRSCRDSNQIGYEFYAACRQVRVVTVQA